METPETTGTDPARDQVTARNLKLKDVAELAGVSTKTVSNVLNDRPHISAHTRERVRQAVAELGYRPNPNARLLRKRRTAVIALAVPEIELQYFAELAAAIHRTAERRDYTVLLEQTGGDEERERRVAAGFRANLIDGLILSPLALPSEDVLAYAGRRPLVLLGERFYPDVPADHVAIDNVAASRAAVAHLIGQGRERIAVVGTQEAYRGPTDLRIQGYREALAQAGLPLRPELERTVGTLGRSDGAQAMTRLLDSGVEFDAVFCLTDLLALGALRELHDRSIRVPDDIAVAGFDDIEEGRFSVPRLTTISPDKQQIAELAVTHLLGRLDGELDEPPGRITADFRLAVRESTAGRGHPPREAPPPEAWG